MNQTRLLPERSSGIHRTTNWGRKQYNGLVHNNKAPGHLLDLISLRFLIFELESSDLIKSQCM